MRVNRKAFSGIWPETKKTLRLAIPMALAQIGMMAFNVIDAIMVGHISSAHLAAQSFVISTLNVGFIFLMGLTTSISIKVAQSYGRNEVDSCGRWLASGCMVMAISLLLLMAVGWFIYFNLHIFNQTAEVTQLARGYFLWILWSFIPFVLFLTFHQFSEGIGDSKIPMQYMLIGIAINAFLNYTLIYGKWGFPRMELVGAGIGTFVARITMSLLFVFHVLTHTRYRPFLSHFGRSGLSKRAMLSLLKIGGPSAFIYLFEIGAFALAAIMAGWIGKESLAAHQITINIASLTFMVPLAISMATAVRVGQAFGRHHVEQCQKIGIGSLMITALFMSATALLLFGGKNFIPTLYVRELPVRTIAAHLLIVAALFQVFDGLQVIGVSTLRGLSDVKIPAIAGFFIYWGVGICGGYVLAFKWNLGAVGVWVGLLVSLTLAAIFMVGRFFWVIRQKRKGLGG
jgi:MATE family multidrug resistance protein